MDDQQRNSENQERHDPRPSCLDDSPRAAAVCDQMINRFPALQRCRPALAAAFGILLETFQQGGTLFICGNGGSMADALHIAGELDKSFRCPRPVTAEQRLRLLDQPDGAALADHLQRGLRTIPLGANPALSSAIANDIALRDIAYAQELFALGRAGDVLLGISTSGNAQNVRHAASVAHASGMKVISLTGPSANPLAEQADVAILAPGLDTPEIQGWHIQLYHALCEMIEATIFDG